jgi:hypothetical protein
MIQWHEFYIRHKSVFWVPEFLTFYMMWKQSQLTCICHQASTPSRTVSSLVEWRCVCSLLYSFSVVLSTWPALHTQGNVRSNASLKRVNWDSRIFWVWIQYFIVAHKFTGWLVSSVRTVTGLQPTGSATEKPGFNSWQGRKIFFFSITSGQALRST